MRAHMPRKCTYDQFIAIVRISVHRSAQPLMVLLFVVVGELVGAVHRIAPYVKHERHARLCRAIELAFVNGAGLVDTPLY